MSTSASANEKRDRQFYEDMLRVGYSSLFWAVISERRKKGALTLQSIADTLGINKSSVSRWFSGDPPNWELNTVAAIASALNIELQPPTAVDRTTQTTFTPAGPRTNAAGMTTPDRTVEAPRPVRTRKRRVSKKSSG